jgi:hypothetical protein
VHGVPEHALRASTTLVFVESMMERVTLEVEPPNGMDRMIVAVEPWFM